jgi:very-short-patch-repair endonuclease
MRKRLVNIVKFTVRKLRQDQTKAEALLWKELRGRKFKGIKFLRQHPIVFELNGMKRFMVADFYCSMANLVIELDGGIHIKQKDYDSARDFMIRSMGLKVLRFNNDKLFNSLDEVLIEIANNLV